MRALVFVVAMASALAAVGCTGAGRPKPGAPPHHRMYGFQNVNPAFETPPALVRLRFLLSRFLSTLVAPVSADFP